MKCKRVRINYLRKYPMAMNQSAKPSKVMKRRTKAWQKSESPRKRTNKATDISEEKKEDIIINSNKDKDRKDI